MHQSLPIQLIRRTRTKFSRLYRDDRRERLQRERGLTRKKTMMMLALVGLVLGFLVGPRVLGIGPSAAKAKAAEVRSPH